MKKTLIFFIILTLTLLASCGSPKKSPEKKIVTKENLLDALHPPSAYGMPTNLMNKYVPVYTEDAREITRDEMMKMTSSGKYKALPYVDDKNEVKLWLVTPMTDADKKMLEEGASKKANIPNLEGKPAKPFTVTDMQGEKFDMKELKGKIVVMNFWFIGCKPCIAEMDDLNILVDKCRNKEVVFIGFATDSKEKLADFLKKKSFNYHVIPDAGTVCESYGIRVFPANLVVDQNSMITYHSTGLVSTAPADMLAEIEKLEKN